MESFYRIVPDNKEPVITLVLDRKTGRIPKGTYAFLEYYCTDPQCDCRRVTLIVLNEKYKQKAVFSFGFDQEGPMAGPYLDTSNSQSPYAAELLEFFVDWLNEGPEVLDRLYRQYRQVREAVEGKRYRGQAFPKPGKLFYRVMPPPDLEAEIEQTLKELRSSGERPSAHRPRGRRRKEAGLTETGRAAAGKGMRSLVERYARLGVMGPYQVLMTLQDDVRRYLLENDEAGEELASLLAALCRQSPVNDEQVDAGLKLLYDALDVLQQELEARVPGARLRMERFQGALAQRIFIENEDIDLCAAVSSTVANSGVEVLPVLRDAHTEMLKAGAERSDLDDLSGEEAMAGISRCLESMGLDSPFEGVQALLELFTLNEPDMQTAITGEMLHSDNPMLREIAALMLFNPDAAVRVGVSQLLAALDGRSFTPETLRRLIVSRNWFPEEIRRNIDQAITSARRARVECAPLAKPPAMTVYASPIDGSGAQSFQVVVREGKRYSSCSVLLKQGVGVADAFMLGFATKRELNEFLDHLVGEAFFVTSSEDHLDRRICQALADGVRQGNVPGCWLAHIAEVLGRDRWNAAPLDAAKELEQLRRELESKPKLLTGAELIASLEDVADWHTFDPIFGSWFEDDYSLHQEMEALKGKRKKIPAAAAVEAILTGVLEKRRDIWLERLVVLTLWLKAWNKSPFPWHRAYHVASLVADRSIPLREIPLMPAIAQLSFDAYQERMKGSRKIGKAR